MVSISVEVDFRERSLIAELQRLIPQHNLENEPYSVVLENDKGLGAINLEVGDVRICINKECVWLYERKTFQDLLASLNDGRFQEQKVRLKTTATEFPDCHVGYLLEGPEFGVCPLWKREDPRMSGAIMSIMNSRSLQCVTRESTTASAEFILHLASHLGKWRKENPRPRETTHAKPSLSKKQCKTPLDIATAALTCVPGMSVVKAKTLLREYGTLVGITRASEKAIANVSVTEAPPQTDGKVAKCRRIGPKLAASLHSVFKAFGGFGQQPPEDASSAPPLQLAATDEADSAPPKKKRSRKGVPMDVVPTTPGPVHTDLLDEMTT